MLVSARKILLLDKPTYVQSPRPIFFIPMWAPDGIMGDSQLLSFVKKKLSLDLIPNGLVRRTILQFMAEQH